MNSGSWKVDVSYFASQDTNNIRYVVSYITTRLTPQLALSSSPLLDPVDVRGVEVGDPVD